MLRSAPLRLACWLTPLLWACGSDPAASQGEPPNALEPPASDPDEPSPPSPTEAQAGVWLIAGGGLPPRLAERVATHLRAAQTQPVTIVDEARLPAQFTAAAWVFALGDTAIGAQLVPESARADLGPEGYALARGELRGATVLAAVGGGAHFGTYALLEELGFAFLHPLAPLAPTSLQLPAASFAHRSAPRWHKRAMHLHTQHPLELTELLQGFGLRGERDRAAFEAGLASWDQYLEWCVANGQNSVEWFLLWADSWKDFADSSERLDRLRVLVERAHGFGLRVGIDAPIAFAQQHAFRLLRQQGDLADELRQIRERLDWLLGSGIDFLGVEAGTSEFTHPAPERMLAWLNEVTRHADAVRGVPVFVKVHASTGQVAEGFPDPRTGEPINFNFLPHFADPRLGVLPHTLQHYGLRDPAPTYGNTDFGYMRTFLRDQVGKRPVVWYPETAYWVSFDIDVPLFLPIYAERRLSDLRLLAQDELADGDRRMDGQLVFSSGWEWGYWLNDVVAARAAWDPQLGTARDVDAYQALLDRALRVFGPERREVTSWIVDVSRAQAELLIEGKVQGVPPSQIEQRNGQAYLQGWDTWDDVAKLAQSAPISSLTMIQPDKLGLVDMRNPLHGGPGYSAEVDPLLSAMSRRFKELADRGDTLQARVPPHTRPLLDDLVDAMRMTALRAQQVHGLYGYVDGYYTDPMSARLPKLQSARDALDAAAQIVVRREQKYRVPADRIASWQAGSTAYNYGYLWTVRSLYYWWRDEGKAVDAPVLPCYLNIINPVDVAFGEGMGTDAARVIGELIPGQDGRSCLAEPASEPQFPHGGLRTRP